MVGGKFHGEGNAAFIGVEYEQIAPQPDYFTALSSAEILADLAFISGKKEAMTEEFTGMFPMYDNTLLIFKNVQTSCFMTLNSISNKCKSSKIFGKK